MKVANRQQKRLKKLGFREDRAGAQITKGKAKDGAGPEEKNWIS